MKPVELLVVDDNAAEALLVLYALEDCTMPVKFHFVNEGTEAIRVLGERNFDLVILDLNLPGLSGYDVLQQCDPKRTPVVVFSVSANQADAQRALALGAREFVHKPVGLEVYRHAVLKMIETWVLNKPKTTSA